jgi:HAD superfamily hydrolase (TIGR01484 family)
VDERPKPIHLADFRDVIAVFTDVDGTLTTDNVLESQTLAAMERLRERGVKLVLVSGRPSGWGECWIRTLPIEGAIVENGALYYARESSSLVRKHYVQSSAVRRRNRSRLFREIRAAIRHVPRARLSADSLQTEVDLAIDYNEQVRLGTAAAIRLESILRRRGVTAVRSSVHVNCWIGDFNKLSTAKRFIHRQWGLTLRDQDPRFVYVGDSFNDAPMFAGFALSVGVANVREIIEHIEHPPTFVTRGREGRGFEEVFRRIAATKR